MNARPGLSVLVARLAYGILIMGASVCLAEGKLEVRSSDMVWSMGESPTDKMMHTCV